MSDVERYYDRRAGAEWERLARYRTEYATTRRAMVEFLPAGCRVLDAGGGPGRYAIDLAGRGHRVVLLDLSSACLDLAREKALEAGVTLENVVHGDARDLGRFGDASFDAVLVLGPLYHLTDGADRRRAIVEALRVLAPGGLLMASFISVFAPVRDVAKRSPQYLHERPGDVASWLETGVSDGGGEFTTAFFVHPSKVRPLMESFGLETLRLAGAEGVVSLIDDGVNGLDGPAWEAWVDLNYRLGEDPTLLGAAEHLLYVGRRVGAM